MKPTKTDTKHCSLTRSSAMQETSCVRFALLLLALALPPSLAPAMTNAFTYQGRLTDLGSPANGLYDLRFTLFDAGTAGVAVAGPVTNQAVNVSGGLFTVTLDFG